MPKTGTATKRRKDDSSVYFLNGGTPTWEVAYLFPPQGAWTEEDFWALDGLGEGHLRVELVNGRLDVLPMPTILHQLIAAFVYDLLKEFTRAHAPGVVLFSGTRVRVGKNAIRDPDIVYLRGKHFRRWHDEKCLNGADLIVEIVSPGPKDEERDWRTKRREYARARIREYWIIDPQKKLVRVLKLKGKTYRVHGDFGPGTQATSALLPGFAVAVDDVLAPPGSEEAE
jgi:Uma2 family endonuclease